jgi:integrase
MRKPWFRSSSCTWFVEVAGKQIPLGKDPRFKAPPKEKPKEPPAAIAEKFHEVMRKRGEPEDRVFEDVVEKYFAHLDTSEENLRATRHHMRWFGDYVPDGATRRIGRMRVGMLKKHMLTEYLATKPHWKPNTRRYAITRILAALNFCAKEGYIAANPLKGYERPRVERRKEIMTDEEFGKMVDAAMPEFRDLILVMRELGTRPGELFEAMIELCDLERGVLLVKNKIKALTDEPFRPVFLTERAKEIIRARIGARKAGNIFLNSTGVPWTRHTGQQHMRRLRTKLGLGKGCTLYALRHRWASHAINNTSVNPALVALQLGHTDLKMLMKTYLHQDPAAMLKAVEEATKK